MIEQSRLPLWLLALAFFLIVGFLVVGDAHAERASSVQVMERRHHRLERIKAGSEVIVPTFRQKMEEAIKVMERQLSIAMEGVDALLQDSSATLCSLGAKEYCPVLVEPELVKNDKVLIEFDVDTSKYNPTRNQTDGSPCMGAFGDVCEAWKEYEMGDGLRPVAASRDIATSVLGRRAKIKLTAKDKRAECVAAEGEYVVLDTMAARFTNSIDLYTPCGDDDCFDGIAKARVFGRCQMVLTKLL